MKPGIGSITWSDLGEELRVLGFSLHSIEVITSRTGLMTLNP